MECRIPFIFIIDEWKCILRENKEDEEAQRIYLDFLRNLLKDKSHVKLAYMTWILRRLKGGMMDIALQKICIFIVRVR